MTVVDCEFLSIQPVEIDTPDFVYKKFEFLYDGQTAQIIARSGYAIREIEGTLETDGQGRWKLTTAEGVWTIDRTRGCACTGQPIIPK